MVKKKKRTKRAKRVRSIQKSPEQVKKDLEIFATGVKRLQELERELDSLDTKGFYREEQEIRNRLKNVSDIPFIERKFSELKQKIKGRYKPKRRGSAYRRIHKELSEIKEGTPKIERQLRNINEKIEEISEKKRCEVDPEIGELVSSDFNDFLREIKSQLSERVKKKEKDINEKLRRHLRDEESIYRGKNASLIREFKERKEHLEKKLKQKYNIKVQSQLHKEVEEKFNRELEKKVNELKASLGKKYKEQLRRHSELELTRRKDALKKEMTKEFSNKILALKKEEQRKIAEKLSGLHSEKEKVVAAKKNLEKRKEMVEKAFRKELEKRERKLEAQEKSRVEGAIARLHEIKGTIEERDKERAKKIKQKEKNIERGRIFFFRKSEERKKQERGALEEKKKQLEEERKRLYSLINQEKERLDGARKQVMDKKEMLRKVFHEELEKRKKINYGKGGDRKIKGNRKREKEV